MTARAPYPALAAVLGALALAAIWLPPFTPGTDTPTHLLTAQVLATPERFDGLIAPHFAPTSQVFVWMSAALLSLGIGLGAAAKVALTLQAAVAAGAALALGRLRGDRAPIGMLFALATVPSFFGAMGFLNFTWAFALGLWAVVAGERAWTRGTVVDWALLGVAALATAAGHVIVAAMFAVDALLRAALRPGPGRTRRVLLTALTYGPAGVFSATTAWVARAGYVAEAAVQSTTLRLPIGEQLANVGTHAFGGFSAWAGWLAVGATAVALGVARRREAQATPWTRMVAWTPVLLWGAVYFATPFHGEGWAWAQPRVLVMALWLPAVASGPFVSPRAQALIGALLVGYVGASLPGVVRAGAAMDAQRAAFGGTPPGLALEVVVDGGDGRVEAPLLHAGKLALANGGASPLLPPFSPTIHSLRPLVERWPPSPPPHLYRGLRSGGAAESARQLDRVAVEGLRFQHVVLVGSDAWVDGLTARGYVVVEPQVLRATPSSLRVRALLPDDAAAAPIVLRVGVPDTIGWFAGTQRAPSPPSADGDTFVVAPIPAGRLRVQLSMGVDGDVLFDDLVDVAAGARRDLSVSLRTRTPAPP